MNLIIAVNPNSQSLSLTITPELTGIFLGSLVSLLILLGYLIKVVTKVNLISNDIKNIREDLEAHSAIEGHEKLLERVKRIEENYQLLDKRFEVHLSDYSGYQDITVLAINGNKELIVHKWQRTEQEFEKTNKKVEELQRYLQQQGGFRIRD